MTFIAIGGPQAHVTLSMTDTLFPQSVKPSNFALRSGTAEAVPDSAPMIKALS